MSWVLICDPVTLTVAQSGISGKISKIIFFNFLPVIYISSFYMYKLVDQRLVNYYIRKFI